MKYPLYNLDNKNSIELSISTIETYLKEILYHGAQYKKLSNKEIKNAIDIIIDNVKNLEKCSKEINEN